MSAQISQTERISVGILNVFLFIAAVLVFYSGLSMSWYHGLGMKEASHAFLPIHLIAGVAFIVLGLSHLIINHWWCKKALRGEITSKLQLFFMPAYVLLFLLMAITALLIWLFGVHDCVPMHKICGYVFLGMVTIHAIVRYGIK